MRDLNIDLGYGEAISATADERGVLLMTGNPARNRYSTRLTNAEAAEVGAWFTKQARKGPRLVIVESPYAGDIDINMRYARACLADCLSRGEAPFASHLLYTQDRVLDDNVPAERELGIKAGLAWGAAADATVVYEDLGVSDGMRAGIAAAEQAGRPIERRSLRQWSLYVANRNANLGRGMAILDELRDAARADDHHAYLAALERADEEGLSEEQIADAYRWGRRELGPAGFDADGTSDQDGA